MAFLALQLHNIKVILMMDSNYNTLAIKANRQKGLLTFCLEMTSEECLNDLFVLELMSTMVRTTLKLAVMFVLSVDSLVFILHLSFHFVVHTS